MTVTYRDCIRVWGDNGVLQAAVTSISDSVVVRGGTRNWSEESVSCPFLAILIRSLEDGNLNSSHTSNVEIKRRHKNNSGRKTIDKIVQFPTFFPSQMGSTIHGKWVKKDLEMAFTVLKCRHRGIIVQIFDCFH